MLHWWAYFLGNFWRKLCYFLLQHLVTLIVAQKDVCGIGPRNKKWITCRKEAIWEKAKMLHKDGTTKKTFEKMTKQNSFFSLSFFLSLSLFLFLHKVIFYWLHPEYQCPTYINTASQIAFLTSWSLDAARHSLSLCVRLCVPAGVFHCVCAYAWTKKGERERPRVSAFNKRSWISYFFPNIQ